MPTETLHNSAGDVKDLWSDHRVRVTELLNRCSVKVADLDELRVAMSNLRTSEWDGDRSAEAFANS